MEDLRAYDPVKGTFSAVDTSQSASTVNQRYSKKRKRRRDVPIARATTDNAAPVPDPSDNHHPDPVFQYADDDSLSRVETQLSAV